MEVLEMGLGVLALAGSALLLALYLLVQFILALSARREHRSWSILWLTGIGVFVVGVLSWNALVTVQSLETVLVGLLLAVFAPFGFWLWACLVLRAERRRQSAKSEVEEHDTAQPEGVWPPAPKP